MESIETKRLRLRHFKIDDIESFMEYRNNEDWMKYQSFKCLSKEEYIEKLLGQSSIKDGLQMAVILKEDSLLIGDIFIIKDNNKVEIGFTINPKFSRKGYIQEVVEKLLSYVRDQYPDSSIIAETDSNNMPSISLLKKLGFTMVSCDKEGCVFEYRIRELSFSDLEQYNNIEMLKTFDEIREYKNLNEYNVTKVKSTTLDFAKDESMSLWREIMEHDKCKIFVIEENHTYIAGAVVVTHSPKVQMLRKDMTNSVLWDIRVKKSHQHKGYGKTLFNKCVSFARNQNIKRMIIETQNNNPTAISFYEKMGCKLIEINKNHYEGLQEDQLIFVKEI